MAETPPPLRVLGAAVSSRRRAPVLNYLRAVVQAGGEAVLLTSDGGKGEVPAGVRRLDVAGRERRLLLHRLLVPGRVWRRWSRSRVYRFLRPWAVWRAARKDLARLDLSTITDVLIVGTESWPVAWHVARHNPEVRIGFSLPDPLPHRDPPQQVSGPSL